MSTKKTIITLTGLSGLVAGALSYIFIKPAGSVLLHNYIPFPITRTLFIPDIILFSSQWLGDFLHVFSFSLIFIGIYSNSRKSRVFFCSLWLALNIIFETGQAFAGRAACFTQPWNLSMPALKTIHNFFTNGTFDVLDIAAFFIGAAAAFFFSEYVLSIKGLYHNNKQGGKTECLKI